MSKLVLLNKPYGVLSQFTDDSGRPTLIDYVKDRNVYPAGRLDMDSEGLLLLTDDGKQQHAIANPSEKTWKYYWVQIEGEPSKQQLKQLRDGVELKDGQTKPAKVKRIAQPSLWQRNPPIRERKNIPTHWLEIAICEGKNRQVRRMTAAVGLPTLRLVRHRIGEWTLGNLQPGEQQTLRKPRK